MDLSQCNKNVNLGTTACSFTAARKKYYYSFLNEEHFYTYDDY